MRSIVPIVAVAIVLVAAAATGAQQNGIVYFRTPSKNIYCGYVNFPEQSGPFVRCDIRSGLRPLPPKPRGCDTDWSTSLEVGTSGRGQVLCAGDSIYSPLARELAYGTTWRGGGFACTSRATGLTCVNRGGHGFFLSRTRWRVY